MPDFDFHVLLERQGDRIHVSCKDLPELLTFGNDEADALASAEDALGVVLLEYLRTGKPIPTVRSKRGRRIEPSSAYADDLAAAVSQVEAA